MIFAMAALLYLIVPVARACRSSSKVEKTHVTTIGITRSIRVFGSQNYDSGEVGRHCFCSGRSH
jgi:hypothetical protein